MSSQLMSQVDVLIHSSMKEKGFLASSENKQEFKGTDHYAFFFLHFSEHNRVMPLNSMQSGVEKQKSKITLTGGLKKYP